MNFFVLVLGLATVFGLAASQGCICPANYQPFCGTDDKTYSNKCTLECAQKLNPSLRVKFEGVCAEPYAEGTGTKSGQTGQNQFQGSSSNVRPTYVQTPRPFPSNDRFSKPVTPQRFPSYGPSSQTNYNQQPTINRPAYQPSQSGNYVQPARQTYPAFPTNNYNRQPTNQIFPTVTSKPIYPAVTPKQTYPVVPKYVPPQRQDYNQPRPTVGPYNPQRPNESKNWIPSFGGGSGY